MWLGALRVGGEEETRTEETVGVCQWYDGGGAGIRCSPSIRLAAGSTMSLPLPPALAAIPLAMLAPALSPATKRRAASPWLASHGSHPTGAQLARA